jgi:hypothetical protein
VLGACGGGDDDAGGSTTSSTVATTVTIAPTNSSTSTTSPPTTPTTAPPLVLVTEGASIVVANASGINGAAGRMTDAIAAVGFDTGAAANSSEGQLGTSKIYYSVANPSAKTVADSLREALGGGDIQVVELAVPAPIDDPDALGDATIILAMGNDVADKTLDELQGRVPPTDDETTGESTGDETTGESTGDETTGEETTGDG